MGPKYKKVIPALDETARARLWAGQSFSSTSSSEDSDDLANLIDSFYDSEGGDGTGNEEEFEVDEEDDEMNDGDLLKELDDVLEEMDDDVEACFIRVEVENAIRVIGSDSDKGLKKRVAAWLLQRGFDAGVCVSSWEPMNGLPAGSHEFIDVISKDKTRYIVEINLGFYFEIAKPNKDYITLLKMIPSVFIARREQMKSIVRLISNASIDSIKSAGMHVAPWRKREYMLAKWFGNFERRDVFAPFLIMEKDKGRNVNCRMGLGERESRGRFRKLEGVL